MTRFAPDMIPLTYLWADVNDPARTGRHINAPPFGLHMWRCAASTNLPTRLAPDDQPIEWLVDAAYVTSLAAEGW